MGTVLMHWIMLGSWVGLGESKGEGALMTLVSVGLGGGMECDEVCFIQEGLAFCH